MYHYYLECMNMYYGVFIPDLLWVLVLHLLPVMKNKRAIKLMSAVTEFGNVCPLEGDILLSVAGNLSLFGEQFLKV